MMNIDLLSNKDFVYSKSKFLQSLKEKSSPHFYEKPLIHNIEAFIDKFLTGMNTKNLINTFLNNNLSPVFDKLSQNQNDYDTICFFEQLTKILQKNSTLLNTLLEYLNFIIFPFCFSSNDNLRNIIYQLLLTLNDNTKIYAKQDIIKISKQIYENLYNLEYYFNYISSHSMQTIILNLSKDEILSFMNSNNIELNKKLENSIKELGGNIFIKLSQRSPKDAYYGIKKGINDDWKIWGLNQNENPEKYFLKVNNISQIKILLKNSNRIQEDLNNFKECQLILRKWINIYDEFRIFICDCRVTAVSSYPYASKDYTNYFRSKKFLDIMKKVPYRQAILDIGFNENDELVIIEINPFGKMSSSALFSWVDDEKILKGLVPDIKYPIINIKIKNQ